MACALHCQHLAEPAAVCCLGAKRVPGVGQVHQRHCQQPVSEGLLRQVGLGSPGSLRVKLQRDRATVERAREQRVLVADRRHWQVALWRPRLAVGRHHSPFDLHQSLQMAIVAFVDC